MNCYLVKNPTPSGGVSSAVLVCIFILNILTRFSQDVGSEGAPHAGGVHHGGADQNGGGGDLPAGGRQLLRAAARDLPQPQGERGAAEKVGAHRVHYRPGTPEGRRGAGGARGRRRRADGFNFR